MKKKEKKPHRLVFVGNSNISSENSKEEEVASAVWDKL